MYSLQQLKSPNQRSFLKLGMYEEMLLFWLDYNVSRITWNGYNAAWVSQLLELKFSVSNCLSHCE